MIVSGPDPRWARRPIWAKTLQARRIRAGLTLRRAAELLGLSPTALSQFENGDREPCPELMDRMGTVYAHKPKT